MEALAILDGRLVPAAQASIPVTDEGLLRGDGAFEVIRLYEGRLFALAEHLERLARTAQTLRLELSPPDVRADVEALAEAAGPVDAAIRVLVTRGGRRIGLLEALKEHPPALRLATVEYAPTRVLDQAKSLSYGANMLAHRLAVERGADEALLVTPHGRVLEGPTSAFFYVLDGRLCTPPLEDHILDSITRRLALSAHATEERMTPREDLARISEAFLCSTTIEVMPVASIDDRELPEVPGPVTAAVAEAVRAAIEARLDPAA